ncbi:hypothetical protein [Rhodococcus sp. HNM0569]|uniref:hypothetical protein n=1 Tax=Rhodococcus sp. HNM0569 TaxID=2716340 RepID=UPI001469AADD|nr:hypothetical protein [Rhodococcus sp. HNM0569]NLU84074.1 hypothetical protein [Rhodococcus sp. HNM0569]
MSGDDVPLPVAAPLLLSKPAIAELAKVQRPVVTMWIKRHRASADPFPSPAATYAGVDHYAADDVVRWIRGRGLGNSETLVEDLALHAVLGHESALSPEAVVAGVSALLCVKALLGVQLSELDAEDLLDEVDALDPGDRFLFREIEELGDEVEVLGRHVDTMSDAAYTPAEAFESLMRQRFRRGIRDLSESALRPAALSLTARITAAVSDHDGAVFVDPSADGSDILVALRWMLPEFSEAVAMTGWSDTPGSRLARRRLVVHQWRVESTPDDVGVRGPATFVTQYPALGSPDMSDAEILSAMDDLALGMRDGQSAVVIGPASALVDPLADRDAEAVRSALLRSDRVRAVLRLPEGLMVSRPGLSTALWVLGSADASIKPSDRWTVLADLRGAELDEYVIESAITDVLAAMGPWESLRAHSFRIGGVYKTAGLLASGSLLPPRPHRPLRPRHAGAEAAGQVVDLVGAYRESAARVDPQLTVPVEYRAAPPAPTVSAGMLAASRELAVVPGNRIDPADLVSAAEDGPGVVRVIGPDEVLGRRALGERGVGRLEFTTRHPSGRYTEPGDIVFCTSPDFGVFVDAEGSSVVLAPARVMRVKDPQASGLVPELIAGHLRAAGVGERAPGAVRRGKPWRAWEIPRVEPERVPAVTAMLADLRRRRQVAEEVVATIDRLTGTLVDGVGRGALVVEEQAVSEPKKG